MVSKYNLLTLFLLSSPFIATGAHGAQPPTVTFMNRLPAGLAYAAVQITAYVVLQIAAEKIVNHGKPKKEQLNFNMYTIAANMVFLATTINTASTKVYDYVLKHY